MYQKTKFLHSYTKIQFISGPALMRTAILTLENQADVWKAGSKNTIPHLLVQYSNIAQPTATLKLIYPNLKLLTRTGSRFPERPYISEGTIQHSIAILVS